MKENQIEDFKNIEIKKLFKIFSTGEAGLDDEEAIKRSKLYGLNEIFKKKRISPIIKFLNYFKEPLVLILILAAIISGAVGQYKNFVIILLMVFLSVILNFYQEHKSNKAAEKISKKIALRTAALRSGQKKEIISKYVVPGDIIILSAGDIVPADGKIIKSDDFFVNESSLTGESFPIEKTSVGKNNKSILFSGTNVVSGSATMIAIKTGVNTEYGKIAENLSIPDESNAFETGIKNFGYLIIRVIIFLVLAIFIINAFFKKNDILNSFIFSIAVAVGIAPELLPMILSVNMAKGSVNMSKKGVLVKRLNAIPDFGSMDILCTDKTGTLTQDRITVVKHLDPYGQDSQNSLKVGFINSYFETGLKSLLDNAILNYKDIDLKGIKKIDEIPYDFIRKRVSIIVEKNKKRFMATKGAPEEIFKICKYFKINNKKELIKKSNLIKFNKLYESLSEQGFRVLAISEKEIISKKRVYSWGEEKDMILTGFIAFYDPPRQSAKETLDFMEKHGIEVKILTGDSPLVAKKICQELGINVIGIVNGEEIDINKMSDDVLANKALNANIFARFSPVQKEKIIAALRKKGKVVGYLGDGINDAPSLKSADVGISVDNAVDVAKETADIILLEKGLKMLMDGVIEGRKIFGNTMKYIMMGLSSNFGNMFSMLAAVIYLPFFPMLPGQILLNNFLYDISQISITTDNVDEEYLSKPKQWNISFIKKFMFVFGPISSVFDILIFYILFSIFNLSSSSFQSGWFIESLATQTLVIYIIRTKKLPFIESRPSKYLIFSTLLIVILGTFITFPFFGHFFGFSPLPLKVFLVIFIVVIIYLLVVELVKHIFYSKILKTSKI